MRHDVVVTGRATESGAFPRHRRTHRQHKSVGCGGAGAAGGSEFWPKAGYRVHRYYDPTTGQFLSVDPLVAETGQPFSYAGDNPVNSNDANGLAASVTIYVYTHNNVPYYVGQTGQGPGGRAGQAQSAGRYDPSDGDGEIELIQVPKGTTANAVEEYVMDELDTYTGRQLDGQSMYMANRQSVGPLPPSYRDVAEEQFAKNPGSEARLNELRGMASGTCFGNDEENPDDLAESLTESAENGAEESGFWGLFQAWLDGGGPAGGGGDG